MARLPDLLPLVANLNNEGKSSFTSPCKSLCQVFFPSLKKFIVSIYDILVSRIRETLDLLTNASISPVKILKIFLIKNVAILAVFGNQSALKFCEKLWRYNNFTHTKI